MPTPTVRRLQLGNELRRVREIAGRTPTEAAHMIDCNVSKISRLELGQSGIAIGDLKLLLEFYGEDADHIEWMMELARNNRERGRWSGYRAAFPEWFRTYVDLEHDAEDIRWTEAEMVPGLLQTEHYIRAQFTHALPFGGPHDIEAAVQARLERQQILDRPDAPLLSAVLSESCLRRMVGNRAIMIEQLERLVELTGRPRVQLQVLPFDSENTTGIIAHRFTLLRIPAPGNDPALEFVYTEDFDDARYADDKETVRAYGSLWNRLQATALGPSESRSMMVELAKQLKQRLRNDSP